MGSSSSIRTLILAVAHGMFVSGCDETVEESASKTESIDSPTSMSQCADIAATQARQDCAYSFLDARRDDAEAIQTALTELPEAIDRDMVLYRLAFNYPSIANRFCARVTTEAFIEKCTQVMGRPHLSDRKSVV